MIANITKGRKAVGAILYDFGPGRRDEHVNPRIVAGNVTGTPMQVARAIDHTARQRPEIKAPIWRTSLSLPDEDGVLPDAQWAEIATAFVADMGFDGAPWVAVRHGDDHVHLTVSRVDWSGQLLTDRWDYRRARQAADRLEEEHGLVRAADRFRAEGPQVRNNELEAARRRGRAHDTALPPEREELRRIVREVRDASRGLGRAAFESGLEDAGVSFRANVAPSTGRMSGYSFTLAGWTDSTDAPVWVAASKVAKDLRWADLGKVLGDGPATPTVPDPRAELVAAARATSTVLQDGPTREELAAAAERGAEILRRGQAERAIVPVPEQQQPAARSTDPAAALLAQWRAIAAGQQPPAEEVPAAPAPIPAWTDKARRPHGRMSNDGLAAAIKRREKELAALTRSKAQAEEQIRTGDAIVTGQVTGPYVRELHQLLARLEKAEPHITEATTAWRTALAADKAATEARTELREAKRLKDMSRWALWRMETSRSKEATRAEQATEAIHENVDIAAEARTAGSKAFELARKETGLPDPAAELTRLREGWTELVGDAHHRDQVHGKAQRSNGRRDVDRLTDTIDRTEKRVGELRQEQALRKEMPKAQRENEGRARSAAARAALPKSRKAAGPRYPGAGYEQPAHLRQPPPSNRGPSHGL
ncbi:relaxase/mobilization nuclease domain-containing protein (plasmid) [Streptomyces sp. PCS3-D2]|uniref:relaxase/mobilization nuclease domain-containing protein n=1 Tax=Streptomyces sp. PCS3-D2 TaxID=1460244 RepID=UPI00044B3ECD|nr:relaxase/mobilization nuclease domain-containing protein [Streptomyces sp. PCS3-D2]WKV76615.1 relaxase/mobilization nuclease domain-containing protein [Streptomyces sp. PCS3-D2]